MLGNATQVMLSGKQSSLDWKPGQLDSSYSLPSGLASQYPGVL